jgi:tetratricopeptide (TPR) repeat protein
MKLKLFLIFTLFISIVYAGKGYRIPGDLLDSVFIHEILLEESPSSNEAIFDLAMAYAYTGQIKKGWDLLKQVPKEYAVVVVDKYEPLLNSPDMDWIMSFKLGFGYYFLKEKSKAVNSFQKAYDKNPKNVWSLGFKSLVLGDEKKLDEAISVCKKALKQEENAIGIHFLLAEGYRKKGDYLKFLSGMMKVGSLQASESRYKRKKRKEWGKRKETLRLEMNNDTNTLFL